MKPTPTHATIVAQCKAKGKLALCEVVRSNPLVSTTNLATGSIFQRPLSSSHSFGTPVVLFRPRVLG